MLRAKRFTILLSWVLVVVGMSGLALAGTAPIASASPESYSISSVAPEGTAWIWIDVQAVNLPEDAIEVTISQDGVDRTLPLEETEWGLSVEAECSPGETTVTFSSEESVDAPIAVTFNDENGLVLATEDDQLVLNPPVSTPGPAPIARAAAAVPTFTPTITGTPYVGQKLTAVPNLPAGYSVSKYQWYRDSTAISGATAVEYKLVNADIDTKTKVVVTATMAGSTTLTGTSAQTAWIAWGPAVNTPTVTVNVEKIMAIHMTNNRPGKIDKIVLHHNAGNLTTEQVYNVWQTREASAHYQVERNGRIGRLVYDGNTAWHAGNMAANTTSIGIEHANLTMSPTWTISDETLENGARLVAELAIYHKLGRPEWRKNVFPHSDFSSTTCPGAIKGTQLAKYIARAQYWYDQLTKAPTTPAPVSPPALPLQTITNKPMARFVLGADMNGDGRGEILAVDKAGGLWIIPGQDGYSTSTNKLSKGYRIGYGYGSYRVFGPGDLDGDGKADILAISSDGKMWLYKGDGFNWPGPRKQIGYGWGGFRVIAAGDVNGDKKPDLLAINSKGILYLYAGKGDGNFMPRVQVATGWQNWSLYAAGDLNGDGKADILGVNSKGQMFQYNSTGNGFTGRKQVGYGWSGYVIASGVDLNGDGKADIVCRRSSTKYTYIYPGRGDGTFATRIQLDKGW